MINLIKSYWDKIVIGLSLIGAALAYHYGKKSQKQKQLIQDQKDDIQTREKVIQTQNDKEEINEQSKDIPVDTKRHYLANRLSRKIGPDTL